MSSNPKKENTYIAHIRSTDGRIQSVSEHLNDVKEGCEEFGKKIGLTHLAGLAGWLHDFGKNTTAFKSYIEKAVFDPMNAPRRGSVDHSTAGGRFIYSHYHTNERTTNEKLASEWVANCIISHHQGLRDYLSPDIVSPFIERVVHKQDGMEEYFEAESTFLEEYDLDKFDSYFAKASCEVEVVLNIIRKQKMSPVAMSLVVKYIFSCLIDADRTNTREFEEGKRDDWNKDYDNFFEASYENLMKKLSAYSNHPDAKHPLNQLRMEMSLQCDESASRPRGIYMLSIPTGGGKTLSSLRFALKHAINHKMERIIYIVPYTTIIEQNADEIRKILQADEFILEHHSNVVDDLDQNDDSYDMRRKQLDAARDNWDRPIIFTTMVQFLNTFYAKGTRNTRRLHRLSNAVLIFDEVQSVPVHCISLFNEAVNFLHYFGQSTSLLCTATQPALDFVQNGIRHSPNPEIVRNLNNVSLQFKRVEIEDLSRISYSAEQLAEFVLECMNKVTQVLVILNTKSAVRKLFLQLEESAWLKERQVCLFHLSTSMCARHRKDILDLMRKALDNKMQVICVSTQLIEAGVDISFDCVIRSIAGLDNIAQAAGRCNRNGRDPLRKVYIIQSKDEVLTNLPEIRIGAEITKRVMTEFNSNPQAFDNNLLSSTAINTYFKYYYHEIKEIINFPINTLDSNIFDLLNQNKKLRQAYHHKYGKFPDILNSTSFATAEKHFEVIHNVTTSVLVPYDAVAREILVKLNGEVYHNDLSELLRMAQNYVVNLFSHEVRELDKSGDLYPLFQGHIIALRETAYSPKFGIETGRNGGWDVTFS